MSYLEKVIVNEPIADVLTALIPISSYPMIDYMYVRFKFEVVASGELMRVYEQLFTDGVFVTNEKGRPIKGPNWSVPDFVTLNKYRTDSLDTPSSPV
ncbi:immunity protein [Pseudomonas sp. HLS-6]|nr:immunity protein [Pseudomonas sp. HLS-6]